MVSEPTNFSVDSTSLSDASLSWTDNSTDEEGYRIYKFADAYVTNFYDFSEWSDFQDGTVSQTEEQWRRDRVALKKNDNNDPNGGYATLDTSVGRPCRFTSFVYRSSFGGGDWDRMAVVDSNGDGYGFTLKRGSDTLVVERRTGHDVASWASGSATMALNEWIYVEVVIMGSEVYAAAYDSSRNLLGKTSMTDSTHAGPFDRVHVYGGYPYYVDEVRVGEATQVADLAADSTSTTITGLKDGRWRAFYAEAYNDTNSDYAQSDVAEGLTNHGSRMSDTTAVSPQNRHEARVEWSDAFTGGGYLVEAYYDGNFVGRAIIKDSSATQGAAPVDTDGRWYDVRAYRWTVDSYSDPAPDTKAVSLLPKTLCRAEFRSDGAVHVIPYKQDDNPNGNITIVRNGSDIVQLPDPETVYKDDEVSLHEEHEYQIRRFTESK